ncbi:hypothetical protein LTR57_008325 [Friedmanniomyces endolithicus]|nr:hypothetical protein LTR57_008325 [Friedmanniomyces endolithicus]
MSVTKQRPSAADRDIAPSNALQSDFNANDDGDSMDADERYLAAVSPSTVEILRELRCKFRSVQLVNMTFEVQPLTEAAALYSVGGIRTTFTIGVGAGGPAAYWRVVDIAALSTS